MDIDPHHIKAYFRRAAAHKQVFFIVCFLSRSKRGKPSVWWCGSKEDRLDSCAVLSPTGLSFDPVVPKFGARGRVTQAACFFFSTVVWFALACVVFTGLVVRCAALRCAALRCFASR